ncbi:MAG TPA: adenylyl-sulfate kinase [Terriglobia bacterium]|nr:adenylyl-sulfate kinase [Terriglobia bacterium]
MTQTAPDRTPSPGARDSGLTIWLTGRPGSGKSTLARQLEQCLRELGRNVEVLDGDEVRKNISLGLGFSKQDRDTNVRRIGYVAGMLTRNGVAVIAAVISPYGEGREFNRKLIGRFVEVYCRCPVEVAEARDIKGNYRKARSGEIKSFTGIDDPYEEPRNAEVIVDTDRETIGESVDKIWQELGRLGYL